MEPGIETKQLESSEQSLEKDLWAGGPSGGIPPTQPIGAPPPPGPPECQHRWEAFRPWELLSRTFVPLSEHTLPGIGVG